MKTQPYHIVRNSRIHGKGVFANKPIRKGTRIIEYTGPIVSREEADEIGAQYENGHSHTMLFQIDKDRVINGTEGGDARYINHSCDPNCEAVQYGDKIFIEAIKTIPKGQELVYDYHLQVPGKITEKVKKEYACFCGSPKCRGTQIAPEILAKQAKKDEKKKQKEERKKLKEARKLEKMLNVKKEKNAKKEKRAKKDKKEQDSKKKDKSAKKKDKKSKDTASKNKPDAKAAPDKKGKVKQDKKASAAPKKSKKK